MGYISFFLIFSTFVAVTLAATIAERPCPEKSSGMIPDPNDCTQYYVCISGTLIPHRCFLGTIWNPRKQTCDWAYNVVDCNGNEPFWHNNQNKIPAQPTWNNKQNQIPNQVPWNQPTTQSSWNNNQNKIPAQPAWNNKKNQIPGQTSWNNKQNQAPTQPSWSNSQNQVPNQHLWNKIPAFPSEDDC